ncbi:MAG: hypothetical protein RML15_07005 [Bacteroidota bacterium]|nr:hypothetical protein [Bacteroidota bacterium]MDW8272141.1 hypothetical protein [Bacteroidota bacterium]
MKNCNRITKLMVLAYYGELTQRERARFESQQAKNPEQAERYRTLCNTLDTIADPQIGLLPPPESEDYWQGLEHSILHRIRQEKRRQHVRIRQRQSIGKIIGHLIPVRVALALGSIVLAFIGGFTLGTRSLLSTTKNDAGSQAFPLALPWDTPPPTAAVASSATTEHLRNFLKRSQLYIATTADRQLACKRCIPIEHQVDHRQFARELLKEAQRLRPMLHHDPKVQKVLQDVEIVLANLSREVQPLSQEQVELLHHIASTTVCEVSSAVESENVQHQP